MELRCRPRKWFGSREINSTLKVSTVRSRHRTTDTWAIECRKRAGKLPLPALFLDHPAADVATLAPAHQDLQPPVARAPEGDGGEADVLVSPSGRVKLNLLSRLNLKRKVLNFLWLTKT
jgi:hypothetical protein